METGVTEIAEAIDVPGAPAPEEPIIAQVRHPVRTIAFNVMRFASVIIGAGLLLRAGSSEEAISAINQDRPKSERLSTKRLVIPEPAFGQVAATEGKAAPSGSKAYGTGSSAGVASPEPGLTKVSGAGASDVAALMPSAIQSAMAAEAGDGNPSDQQAPKLTDARPAPSRPSSANASAARLAEVSPPRAAENVRAAALLDKPIAAPAKRVPAVKMAASVPLAATDSLAPSILSPTRRSTTASLLAPVTSNSRPIAVAVNSAPSAVRSPAPSATNLSLSDSTSAPTIISGSSLSSSKRQAAAARAVVSAPLSIGTATGLVSGSERRPAIASVGAGPATNPAKPALVNISLAPPVMTAGPRTTVRTSNIQDVMRRPASAWDYAEALPPELMGRRTAGQRSASAPPAVQASMPQAQVAQAQVAQARAVQMQDAGTRTARLPAMAQASKPVSADASAGVSKDQATSPIASASVVPRKASRSTVELDASRPVALLDVPDGVQPNGPARPAGKAEDHGAKALPVTSVSRRLAAQHAEVLFRPKSDLPKSKPTSTDDFAADERHKSHAPSSQVSAADPIEPIRIARVLDSTESAFLADASSPNDAGLSLRDRIPRPAF